MASEVLLYGAENPAVSFENRPAEK